MSPESMEMQFWRAAIAIMLFAIAVHVVTLLLVAFPAAWPGLALAAPLALVLGRRRVLARTSGARHARGSHRVRRPRLHLVVGGAGQDRG